MIAREMILHAFHNETCTSEETAVQPTEKAGYQVPKLNKIGKAQKLLQGGWVTGDYDGCSNSYSRAYN